ncbi:MAG: nuclear transport factor 2 family protein [Gammaproteobacteria bacterium]
MRRHSFGLIAALATALPLASFAQAPAALEKDVKAAEAAYWKAYNDCDYAKLDALTAEDVEFYHDKGGMTNGRAALTDAVRKNICGNPAVAVRRDAAAKDVQAFMLERGPEVYGALITGQHRFTNVPKSGGAEVPTDRARYTMLWLRKDNAWKLSRVVSYDHQPIPFESTQKAVTLSAAELDAFAGSYAAHMQPVLVFKRAGANLSVDVGGRPMTLYPLGKTTFFMKEQPIEVEFKPAVGGKSPGFVVRQNGAPVDEGVRQ